MDEHLSKPVDNQRSGADGKTLPRYPPPRK